MIRFVYVDSPYTLGDVAVNVRASIDAADVLAVNGLVPCSPLLCHFWHLVHPHEYQFWIDQTLAWLERCDAVLRLPGESAGADAEVRRAAQLGMPVFHSLDELLGYVAHQRALALGP